MDFPFGLAKNEPLVAEIAAELAAAEKGQHSQRPAGAPVQGVLLVDARQLEPPAAGHCQGGMDRRRGQSAFCCHLAELRGRRVTTALRGDLLCPRRYGKPHQEPALAKAEECQLDLFADRTSAATMRANQLRLWFASMAFVLRAPRRLALQQTQLAKGTCGTIRLKLLKIGALVRTSVRRITCAMASGCPTSATSPSLTPR